jgi:DNA repair protein RadC
MNMTFHDNMYLVTEKRIRCMSVAEHVAIDYGTVLANPSSVEVLLAPFFAEEPYEVVYAVALNNQNRFIGLMRMEEGTVNRTFVHARKLLTFLLCETNASGLVLAHNHPGGKLEASKEDIALTKQVKELVYHLDVRLLDHLIYTPDDGWLSLAEMGLV